MSIRTSVPNLPRQARHIATEPRSHGEKLFSVAKSELQYSSFSPNCTDLGRLHCVDTCPNCPELQLVFGSQNLTRLVMLPPCASNRILTRSVIRVSLKRLTSSTKFLKPRTLASRLGALPNCRKPGSDHPLYVK